MLRLSAPSQRSMHADSYTSRATTPCSSTKRVSALLGDWRAGTRGGRLLTIDCTLENKLGQIAGLAPKLGRAQELGQTGGCARSASRVLCSRVEALPWSAEESEEAGVKCVSAPLVDWRGGTRRGRRLTVHGTLELNLRRAPKLRCAHELGHAQKLGQASACASSARSICAPLGDWRTGTRRGRRLTINGTLEPKLRRAPKSGYAPELGQTGGCARSVSKVRCSRVEALPWNAKELEERFGQAGVKFVEAAGYNIVEMRLNEGSSVRIVLQGALVASYKSGMWHGGVEELLYTAVVPGVERPTTVGGVSLRVWDAEAAGSRESRFVASTDCWDVEAVKSNPSQYVQITLSTTSKSQDFAAGAILQIKYVLTLTEASLSCAFVTTNVGSHPVSIQSSLQTSVAVNFVDGAYVLGLQGYKYRSGPHDEMVVEKEDMVRMKGGIDRFYTEIQDSVSLLDRGKRRSVNFHSIGFDDVRVSNPGEKSGLEDWDSFVCIELARLSLPVRLLPGEEWRAAQQLENPSK